MQSRRPTGISRPATMIPTKVAVDQAASHDRSIRSGGSGAASARPCSPQQASRCGVPEAEQPRPRITSRTWPKGGCRFALSSVCRVVLAGSATAGDHGSCNAISPTPRTGTFVGFGPGRSGGVRAVEAIGFRRPSAVHHRHDRQVGAADGAIPRSRIRDLAATAGARHPCWRSWLRG